MTLTDNNGRSIQLDRKLGSGGEAEVRSVSDESNLVAKIYFAHSYERMIKLQAMLGRPPTNPTSSKWHSSICWPNALLFDNAETCVGFLMHRVDFSTNVRVLELYNPRDRQRVAPGFTWSYLVRTAANIASVVEAVHACGYVIGDLNESNFLVSDQALVTLVDCDSIQVPKPDRDGFFRCTVGKPEFTPPELQGMDFSQTDRDSTHDNFALGVMIFQLLMEGVHPYAGVWHGAGEPPPLEDRIRAGDSPYAGSTRATPMPAAVSFEILPVSLRSLILRCFGDGQHNPSSRPAAREWGEALGILDRNLNTCSVNERHVFSNHLPGCPWCERSLLLRGFDSFPQTIQQQPADTTTFTVLRAIEAERPTVKAIVRHVLSLSKDAQDDLARLLESTSLTAIIEATTSVAKRLELLKALEHLVSDYKATLRERSELHRILAENTWVFGEQFHRTVDDESLNVVLERHLSLLGRHSLGSTEVRREDGTRAIVDLMLSRRVAFPRAEEREHLVIELKRPNKKIDHNVLNQIESYATAVARDDRFRESTVRWTFVAISNELSDSVKEKASQRDRPPGCVFVSHDNSRHIYVKTWGQIIDECQARLQFFKDRLAYNATRESALAHVRREHGQYIRHAVEAEPPRTRKQMIERDK